MLRLNRIALDLAIGLRLTVFLANTSSWCVASWTIRHVTTTICICFAKFSTSACYLAVSRHNVLHLSPAEFALYVCKAHFFCFHFFKNLNDLQIWLKIARQFRPYRLWPPWYSTFSGVVSSSGCFSRRAIPAESMVHLQGHTPWGVHGH